MSSERCEQPDEILNGTISYQDNDTSNVLVGDIISYSCDPGTELQGPNQRFCQRSGNWSDSEPLCIGEALCWLLPADVGFTITLFT